MYIRIDTEKGETQMIRPIMRDTAFLKKKSTPAGRADLPVAADLRDTLEAHREGCVGMAANMIGFSKRIIIFSAEEGDRVMLNPVIVSKSGRYETEEGCLSLTGKRKTVRYERITVKYQNEEMKTCRESFSGFTAQIIQHECDHLEGIII